MTIFDKESFSDDRIACDILNGSKNDDDDVIVVVVDD